MKARDDGEDAYKGPVVVITGNDCVSACEGLVMMLRVLPTVTVVGNFTGGASGNPSSVTLGNGVKVSYSRWVSLLPDGTKFERVGIEPDELFVAEGDEYEDLTYEYAINKLRGDQLPTSSPTALRGPTTTATTISTISSGANFKCLSIALSISASIVCIILLTDLL